MLEKIKLALRIKSSVTDDDIKDLILAAKTDLSISGVKKIEDDSYNEKELETFRKKYVETNDTENTKRIVG